MSLAETISEAQLKASVSELPCQTKEALQELARKSFDKFTGSVVLHFQDGVALDVETRTKRRLKRPQS